MTSPDALLFAMTLLAAAVNGAFGFGFSTLLVPVGLTMVVGRVLNPALVLLEVPLNLVALVLARRMIPGVWRQTLPLLLGLLPGVIVGSLVLAVTATQVLKGATYVVLLPLVLLQLSGARSPLSIARPRAGVPAGFGIGVLYATTTISGPPLAMLFARQSLEPDAFRASMAIVRVVESVATLVMFLLIGLVTAESAALSAWLLPAVALGVPLGRLALRRLDREAFRRLYLNVNAVLVTAGLGVVLSSLGWVDDVVAAALVTALTGFLIVREWRRATAPKGVAT